MTNWKQMNGRFKRARPTPRRRPRRGDPALDLGPGGGAVDRIVAVPHLLACFEHNRRHGGQAPGPDGILYADFGRQELTRLFGVMQKSIAIETYRAPASRRVDIPKTGGTRTLALDNVAHRALASAAQAVLEPALARHMSPLTHSAGGRGVHTLLRALYHAVGTGRFGVLVNHDVRSAFPSLPLGVALLAYREVVACPRLLALVELLLRGGDDTERHVGIAQGMALSPVTLDLAMSRYFDRHWSGSGDSLVPAWRYVDNLVLLAGTMHEGRQAVVRCRTILLGFGLALKDLPEGEHLCDLTAGGASELLGFRLFLRDGSLAFDLASTALDSLRVSLTQAHSGNNPALVSRDTVLGWIAAMGPAFDRTRADPLTEQVLRVARRAGFGELSPDLVRRTWGEAGRKWQNFLHHCPLRTGTTPATSAEE